MSRLNSSRRQRYHFFAVYSSPNLPPALPPSALIVLTSIYRMSSPGFKIEVLVSNSSGCRARDRDHCARFRKRSCGHSGSTHPFYARARISRRVNARRCVCIVLRGTVIAIFPVIRQYVLEIKACALLRTFGLRSNRFYLSGPWRMGNWSTTFTASVLAIAAIQYHSLCGPDSMLSEVLAYFGIAIATWTAVVNFCHFIRDVFTYKVFTAEHHLAPLMFIKMAHEGIRCETPPLRCRRCADAIFDSISIPSLRRNPLPQQLLSSTFTVIPTVCTSQPLCSGSARTATNSFQVKVSDMAA
jgi:hypothetical protein